MRNLVKMLIVEIILHFWQQMFNIRLLLVASKDWRVKNLALIIFSSLKTGSSKHLAGMNMAAFKGNHFPALRPTFRCPPLGPILFSRPKEGVFQKQNRISTYFLLD